MTICTTGIRPTSLRCYVYDRLHLLTIKLGIDLLLTIASGQLPAAQYLKERSTLIQGLCKLWK